MGHSIPCASSSVGQYWEGAPLVLYSCGLQVLDQIKEVFTGHCAFPVGCGDWTLFVSTSTLKGGREGERKGGREGGRRLGGREREREPRYAITASNE